MPACAGIFQRERSRAPLRCSRFDSGDRPFAAVGDGLVPALTAASGDTLPQRDLSPGSLPVAGSRRDTGGLAALPPSPTPPSAHGLSPALRTRICAAQVLARICGFAQAPLGFRGSLSLRRSRIRRVRSLSPGLQIPQRDEPASVLMRDDPHQVANLSPVLPIEN